MVGVVNHSVRYSYDRVADASYISIRPFRPASVLRTGFVDIELQMASINIDFGRDGKVEGIEILGSSRLLRAERLVDTHESGNDCSTSLMFDSVGDSVYIRINDDFPTRTTARKRTRVRPEQLPVSVDFLPDDTIAGIEIGEARRFIPPELLQDTNGSRSVVLRDL